MLEKQWFLKQAKAFLKSSSYYIHGSVGNDQNLNLAVDHLYHWWQLKKAKKGFKIVSSTPQW